MAAEKSGEFRGKTVEAAISNGLAALGLAREEVEVESCGRAAAACWVSAPRTRSYVLRHCLRHQANRVRPEPAQHVRSGSRACQNRAEPAGTVRAPACSAVGAKVGPKPRSAPRQATSEPAQSAPILDTITDPKERAAVEAGREILQVCCNA